MKVPFASLHGEREKMGNRKRKQEEGKEVNLCSARLAIQHNLGRGKEGTKDKKKERAVSVNTLAEL